jgi:hypothetical protein
MSEIQSIRLPNTRYGDVQIHLENDIIVIQQDDEMTSYHASNSMKEIHYIKKSLEFREKTRLYCNLPLRKLIPDNYLSFHVSNSLIIFHSSYDEFATSGSIVRSTNSMELAFYMPHEFLKQRQTKRLHLRRIPAREISDWIMFEIIREEPVTWATRHSRVEVPAITIG